MSDVVHDDNTDQLLPAEIRASDNKEEGQTVATTSPAPAIFVETRVSPKEVSSLRHTNLDLEDLPPLPESPVTSSPLPSLPPSPVPSSLSFEPESVRQKTELAVESEQALIVSTEKPQASEQKQDGCQDQRLPRQNVALTSPVMQGALATVTQDNHLVEWSLPQQESGKWSRRFLAGRPGGGLRKRRSPKRQLVEESNLRVVKIRGSVQRPVKAETTTILEPLAEFSAKDLLAALPAIDCPPSSSVSPVIPANVPLPSSPTVSASAAPASAECMQGLMDLESIETLVAEEDRGLPMVISAAEIPEVSATLPPDSLDVDMAVDVDHVESDLDIVDIDVALSLLGRPGGMELEVPPIDEDDELLRHWTEVERSIAQWNLLGSTDFEMSRDLDFAVAPMDQTLPAVFEPVPPQEEFDFNQPVLVPEVEVPSVGAEEPGFFTSLMAACDVPEGFVHLECANFSPLTQALEFQPAEAPADVGYPLDATSATEQFPDALLDPALFTAQPPTVTAGESLSPLLSDTLASGLQLDPAWDPSVSLDSLFNIAGAMLPVTGGLSPVVENEEERHPACSSEPQPAPVQPDTVLALAATTSCLERPEVSTPADPAPVQGSTGPSASPTRQQKGKDRALDEDKPSTELGQEKKVVAIGDRKILKPRFSRLSRKKHAAGASMPSLVVGEGSSRGAGTSVQATVQAAATPTTFHEGVAGARDARPAQSTDNGNDLPSNDAEDEFACPLFLPMPQSIEEAASSAVSQFPEPDDKPSSAAPVPRLDTQDGGKPFSAHDRVSDDKMAEMLDDPTIQIYMTKVGYVIDVGATSLALCQLEDDLCDLWADAARQQMAHTIATRMGSLTPGWDSSSLALAELAEAWLDAVTGWPEVDPFVPEFVRGEMMGEMAERRLL